MATAMMSERQLVRCAAAQGCAMNGESAAKMHTRSGNKVCIPNTRGNGTHTPAESLAVTDFPACTSDNEATRMHTPGVCNPPEFVSSKRAAQLVGCAPSTISRQCKSGKFDGAKKALVDGVEIWQIPIASLPPDAQQKVREEVTSAIVAEAAKVSPPSAPLDELKYEPAEYRLLWDAFERSGATHKRRANAAHSALWAFHELVDSGCSIGDAEKAVASSYGVSKPTLWRYRTNTNGHPRCHWLPLLSPKYKGGRPQAEFTQAAYDWIRAEKLTQSKKPLTAILTEARIKAPSMGWVIPSYDAVFARLKEDPAWLTVAGCEGPKALERRFPPAKKNYSSLALHQVWESDGRKSDVWCVWPDGTIARPFIVIWREVRSRLVLGVKGYIAPTAEIVLASFGQALERAGTAPKYAKIDNGREYAAKAVTGGQPNRYRFKVKPGEQPGVMTKVGTLAYWSPPGRGRDKPIESSWNFIANYCDKSSEFEGAYCGRNPVEKPENFHTRNAIPIAVYAAKLAATIEYFNTQHRHSGDGMDGRTPLEVYTELNAQSRFEPVDPAHIRLCKMGMAEIKPDKRDATYTLKIPGVGKRRFWSADIAGLPQEILSRKHAVYYDLENPVSPVSIHDGEKWLGDAPMIDAIDFVDEGGARAAAHVKAKNAYLKPKKEALKAIKSAGTQQTPTLDGVTQLTVPPSINAITIAGRKEPPVRLEAPYVPTEEEEKALAESRRRAEEKQLLNRLRFSNAPIGR